MKAHFSTELRSPAQLAVLGLIVILALGRSGPALAVDGCKLLLCMAGNWQAISECQPTVHQALRDLARGRGWPSCSMGKGAAPSREWVAPAASL